MPYRQIGGSQSGLSGVVCSMPSVAPLRDGFSRKPWEGEIRRKPWEYQVTAVIPHLDQIQGLKAVLATLRAQSDRPYIIIVDTGSRVELLEQVLQLSAEDCEVHCLRPLAWKFTSQPVAAAMDLAFGLCQTEYLYATHTDVFLKRPDYLERLQSLCGPDAPIVGYQMSPRPWRGEMWREMVSHTASLYHMPSMRQHGVTWNMHRALELLGLKYQEVNNGWPDTEVAPSLVLKQAGIGVRWLDQPVDTPACVLIGPEENRPYEDDNLVHVRSTTVHALYRPERTNADLLAQSATAAEQRAARWRFIPRGCRSWFRPWRQQRPKVMKST